ncbi:MAG TPA: IS21 family transposase [Syntrophobacteraceae bacterium]|nr:IS21 family transposase [Syntrophobacteraceae bacterium]
MANHLGVAMVNAITTLKRRGWSMRRISRELGVDRETVKRHVERAPEDSNPASNAPPGSNEDSTPATKAPLGSEAIPDPPDPQPPGRASQCEPFRTVVEEKLEMGLSAQRIYQDLEGNHGYTGSYYSVRRFVKRLARDNGIIPFRRMECAPGEEGQVDFGTGAPVLSPEGHHRRSYVLRITLSHSRKGYCETVSRQTTDNLISCLENAFRYFGGVPKTLVIDNLRAAVSQADWYDPQIHPKFQSFCDYYGTVLLPTKPYTPRHKGKIERGIAYVKDNALKGKRFGSMAEQNDHLLTWETHVADRRIHGTTRQQVGRVFEEQERPALLPLPVGRFPSFAEAKRSVHRDGHIEVKKAYYSVPPEYTGREVWARWDGHVVRILNHQMEQIALHVQTEPGRFQTQSEHLHSTKISSVERGATWLLKRVELLGPSAEAWSKAMLTVRGIQGVRVLVGLLSLAHTHPVGSIDRACQTALSHGAFRLRTLRTVLKRGGSTQEEFAFLDEHPIIRDLSDYGAIVKAALK